jgi:hypothetical protein
MKNLLYMNKTENCAIGNLGIKHSKNTELWPAIFDLYNFIIANGETPMAFTVGLQPNIQKYYH